jgi:cGMP-dependent protein kinase
VISECQHVATLGAGGFGRVTLVRYRGGSYALKQMAKGHIVDNKLVAHVHREKKVRCTPHSSALHINLRR